jgi:hypothetical protein
MSRINSFMTSRQLAECLFAIVFLLAMGYLESRTLKEAPIVASITWIWALLIATIAVAKAPLPRGFGPVLATIVMFAGMAGIILFHKQQKKKLLDGE